MNDPNNAGPPPGMPYPGGQGMPPGQPYGGQGGPPQGMPPYPGGPGGPPPMMPAQGGAPAPRRRGWVMPVAIIGGIALFGCLGCIILGVIVSARGGSATPTVAAANVATSTPAATRTVARTPGGSAQAGGPTPTTAPIVISGCGSATIRNPSSQVSKDIDQWNRVVKSANEITRAWNAFYDAAKFNYDEAAGNQAIVALANTFLATANANLPALRAETTSGRFATMAKLQVADAEAQIAFVTPYRDAVANSDKTAWNLAIDKYGALKGTNDALEAEVDNQCAYWRSV